jgi:CheY-like chemotaxis protein
MAVATASSPNGCPAAQTARGTAYTSGSVVIAEAADGTTALELARHLRPDVVLADVRMPGLDGLHLPASSPAPASPTRSGSSW